MAKDFDLGTAWVCDLLSPSDCWLRLSFSAKFNLSSVQVFFLDGSCNRMSALTLSFPNATAQPWFSHAQECNTATSVTIPLAGVVSWGLTISLPENSPCVWAGCSRSFVGFKEVIVTGTQLSS